jgi:hypothetical protein
LGNHRATDPAGSAAVNVAKASLTFSVPGETGQNLVNQRRPILALDVAAGAEP